MPKATHKPPDAPTRGFLLHVFHRQQRDRTIFYATGRLETGETFGLIDDRLEPSFFVRKADAERVRGLAPRAGVRIEPCAWTTMDGEPVERVASGQQSSLRGFAERLQSSGTRTYEADVAPTRRYLIDRKLRGSVHIEGTFTTGVGVDRVYHNPSLSPSDWEPRLAALALDIETDEEASRVYAVSLVGWGPAGSSQMEEIHLVGEASPSEAPNATCHADEKQLLTAVAKRIREIDPDLLTGWNVLDFDLPVLQRRFQAHGVPFNLGRTRDESWYRAGDTWGGSRMTVYGRQVLDALHLVRATLRRFDDFRLATVAQEILGRGKTLETESGEGMAEAIERAYREDRAAFCEYCLEDSRLVRDILQSEGLLDLTIRRSLVTGLPLERAWGSVAAFEFLYLSDLHSRGIVAPTTGVDRHGPTGSPGGLVMAPESGLYQNVFVCDFKSLYPSIIRTFNIDPLSHVRAGRAEAGEQGEALVAPNGARFDREPGILPAMLESLFAARDRAKTEGDEQASFTYKILMNSFYGVLATDSCRFASGQLAGAITGFGQYLLRWVRDLLEAEGLRVLYGDTDSVFVESGLPDSTPVSEKLVRGRELCEWVNEKLREHVAETHDVESHLELEFEKLYRRFLLPSMRGDEDRARAKGYAGLHADGSGEELDIVGMEAVRRDWTDLAHALQRDLLDRLFRDADADELEACVREWIRSVRAGERDNELVYRKGLRKPVSAYTKATPPHVKAAMLLPNPSGVIHYVMTVDGPQPVGHVTAAPDYEHYVQRQIEPIVRTIGQVCGLDVRAAVTGERSLFAEYA